MQHVETLWFIPFIELCGRQFSEWLLDSPAPALALASLILCLPAWVFHRKFNHLARPIACFFSQDRRRASLAPRSAAFVAETSRKADIALVACIAVFLLCCGFDLLGIAWSDRAARAGYILSAWTGLLCSGLNASTWNDFTFWFNKIQPFEEKAALLLWQNCEDARDDLEKTLRRPSASRKSPRL